MTQEELKQALHNFAAALAPDLYTPQLYSNDLINRRQYVDATINTIATGMFPLLPDHVEALVSPGEHPSETEGPFME